jgi:hypothetical protein
VATPGGTVQGVAKKKIDFFLCSTDFKLLSKIKINSPNNCDFFKVQNFC